ncbi:carbon-nitrogen hydrolase family protein [Halomonas sp. MCCC 1A17488]|uniref:carbon-nitrogen hydrolase family protein n=1 Tax=unclassified Halomonas TaxID=2609666 RepID=UPI0018D240CB|nr:MULTISPECIES: carbon-nitrogen hydrolase family protein [unclassified Halomonas]MCE8016544.1 carbon-nitrogen hydrolase family protein [Halomonas sp. MCCC 1A17488]MCG3239877.1 carbon-nitrogen hydrolase family protein [Halomonas sp. MCCC 1A17488]QPP50227.1 carbon-nitrogen hydrolase family protein [Halomonas sp. SS10-MC5]
MKLCAVQYACVTGDIEANLERHVEFVERAAAHDAELIFFPELSLTGYEPSLARALATHVEDPRLDAFQRLSDSHGIIIAAGLPLVTSTKPQIGMVVFQPHLGRQAYAKQRLHDDELPYFSAGERPMLIETREHRLAQAICYESLQPDHVATAASLGADVYLASVAKLSPRMDEAYAYYATFAREHAMTILMANCIGPCDGETGGGRSAAWIDRGKRVATLDGQQEAMLLLDTATLASRMLMLAAPAA